MWARRAIDPPKVATDLWVIRVAREPAEQGGKLEITSAPLAADERDGKPSEEST